VALQARGEGARMVGPRVVQADAGGAAGGQRGSDRRAG
jgi:hypothetical protein